MSVEPQPPLRRERNQEPEISAALPAGSGANAVRHRAQWDRPDPNLENLEALAAVTADMRRAVLCGGFALQESEELLWRPVKSQLMVFFSSTFTDSHRERDILQNEILPSLRKQGVPEGVEVTFVDMRWGVRDENTLDHQTWIACSREIERCRDQSDGIFFISLQGDK
jgi:hypothetical protein